MADMLKFELVSPEKLLFSGEVTAVTVPGTEGDFTVMVDHAPVLSTLRPGVIVVTNDKSEEKIFVRGGFIEVNSSGASLLAEKAIPLKDLNASEIAQQVKNMEEDVADAKDAETKRRAEENLEHLKQLQASL